MLRSPLRQPGMGQGQSRSSAHAQPRRRGYALLIEPSRIGAARTPQDNAALGRLFAELLPELPAVAPGPPQAKPESVEWFRAVLAAPLSDAELRRLGIAVRASALVG